MYDLTSFIRTDLIIKPISFKIEFPDADQYKVLLKALKGLSYDLLLKINKYQIRFYGASDLFKDEKGKSTLYYVYSVDLRDSSLKIKMSEEEMILIFHSEDLSKYLDKMKEGDSFELEFNANDPFKLGINIKYAKRVMKYKIDVNNSLKDKYELANIFDLEIIDFPNHISFDYLFFQQFLRESNDFLKDTFFQLEMNQKGIRFFRDNLTSDIKSYSALIEKDSCPLFEVKEDSITDYNYGFILGFSKLKDLFQKSNQFHIYSGHIKPARFMMESSDLKINFFIAPTNIDDDDDESD